VHHIIFIETSVLKEGVEVEEPKEVPAKQGLNLLKSMYSVSYAEIISSARAHFFIQLKLQATVLIALKIWC